MLKLTNLTALGVTLFVVMISLSGEPPAAQILPADTQLKIAGPASPPLVLTTADLKSMSRKTLRVLNPHGKKTEVYEGVLLEDLLRKAGIPLGEHLRGPSMAMCVLAEATDGYQ